MSLHVESAIEPIADEWEALADRAGTSLFLRPGWFSVWIDAFGAESPEFLTTRHGGELTGVLPLRQTGGVVRSMANEHTYEFAFLTDGTSPPENELADALLERTATRCTLVFVDPAQPGLAAIRASAARLGHRLLVDTNERSPYVQIVGDWSAQESLLDAKLRSNLRRSERRLAERGTVEISMHTTADGLDALLDECFAVEASGWKGEAGTAITNEPQTDAFYRGIAKWAAARGALSVGVLRVGEHLVAFELDLRDRDVHYRIKGGYDLEFRDTAPGKVLVRACLEDAVHAGCSRYDFLGNVEPYKLEWATGLRALCLIRLYARSPSGRAAFATTRALSQVQRVVGRLRR